MKRRQIIQSFLVGLSLLSGKDLWGRTHEEGTPAQTEGPFYPERDQADKDVDLTRIAGHTQSATGEVIYIVGRVLNLKGEPLANAQVELWQANKFGRYAHSRDPNTAPLDEHFQGWGIAVTNAQGEYRFKTILPGSYPASPNWVRPPHIHFKINKTGYRPLTTQMYFPEQPLNKSDLILQSLSVEDQNKVVARKQESDFVFDIVLA